MVVIGVSQAVGGHLNNNFSSGSSPSGRAQRIDRLVAALRPLPHVTSVTGPLAPGVHDQVSRDQTIADATVQFDGRAGAGG